MFMKTTLRSFLAVSLVILFSFFQVANATIRTFQFSGTTSSFDGSTSGVAMSATLEYDDASTPISSGTGYATYNYISFTITIGGTTYTASPGTIQVEIPPSNESKFTVSDNEGLYQLSLDNTTSQVFSSNSLPSSLTLSDFTAIDCYIAESNFSGGDYQYYATISSISDLTPAFITPNSGTTPQSAAVNMAFTNPLAATVTNASGTALSGISVTFTSPSSGASGTFSNSTNTITINTDVNGNARAGTFTANGNPGSYSVSATVTSTTVTTSFSLTNNANCPSTYTLSASGYQATTGTWTAPPMGGPYLIQITAAGAVGGGTGGAGAVMSGSFIVNAGQQLDITAGGEGGLGTSATGGGGGSGVIVDASSAVLIIAGGGGGSGNTPGGIGITTASGSNTGTAGNGGATGTNNAGGGGGLNTAGASGSYGGGAGFNAAGGLGGAPGGGGFGGGGGGGTGKLNDNGSNNGGGGGGGYSGGNGAGSTGGGYGGGSINYGTTQSNTAGGNSGGGYVTIQCLGMAGPTSSVLGLSTDGTGLSEICNGSSTNLSVVIAGGTSPYTVVYSDGINNDTVNTYSSGTNISVSPTTTITYSLVSVTDANSVAGTGNGGTATVTVNPLPTATLSGSTAICSGTNTTLSIALTGTVPWSVTYMDGTTPVTQTGITASPYTFSVSPSASSTYSISAVSDANCTGTGSGTASITVNPLPAATIGETGSPVCVGGASPSITFTGSGATAPYTFTYTQTSGSNTTTGLTATGGSPSYSINVGTSASGTSTYTLTAVTDASSTACTQSVSSQSVSAIVNPIPSATIGVNTAAVCQSGTYPTITFIGSGGKAPYTFTYNINSGTPATISDLGSGSVTISVSTLASGNYTYTLTDVQDSNGCTPQSITGQSVDITVNPLPVATINTASMVTAVTTGNTASVANAGTGSTYVWTISNGTITAGSGTDLITYTAGATGNVSLSVAVTSPSGCGPVSSGTLLVPITALPCPKAEITVASAVCTASAGNIASVAAVSGNTYVWTISNGTITAGSGTSSITYTAGATGNVSLSVTVTNASGQCSISSGTYKICIIPLPIAAIIAAPVVCSASTNNIAAVLYAGPGATYGWTITGGTITAGSGTPIIKYTAGSSGSVTLAVTVTNSTGCKASSGSKSITISAYPVATITAATAVCAGSSGNTASVASAGSGAHYGWSISNGCITSGSATNSITYTASGLGSVTLSVTVTNASGCSTASAKKLVTIVAAPSASITATGSVCTSSTGNTASVASAGTGGTYTWSISNGTITAGSGTDKITYTAGVSGSVSLSVTVTNSTGCKASSGTREIAIAPLPSAAITASGSVCSLSTGNTASVAGAGTGATYTWAISGGTINSGSGTSSIKYTAGMSGSVTLSVTVTSGGGCKASGAKSVTISAKTVPTFSAIAEQCLNATPPVLPTTSKNGISGTWSPSKISTSATGSKTYTFTPATGDCASSVAISVTVEKCTQEASITEGTLVTGTPEKTAASESEEKLTAVVYPNPSIIGFRLELKSSIKETVDILVIDLMGNPIYHTRGEATGSYLFGERFVKGMYFVEIIHQDGIKTLKIIKQ
jgi:hypothetical protein